MPLWMVVRVIRSRDVPAALQSCAWFGRRRVRFERRPGRKTDWQETTTSGHSLRSEPRLAWCMDRAVVLKGRVT